MQKAIRKIKIRARQKHKQGEEKDLLQKYARRDDDISGMASTCVSCLFFLSRLQWRAYLSVWWFLNSIIMPATVSHYWNNNWHIPLLLLLLIQITTRRNLSPVPNMAARLSPGRALHFANVSFNYWLHLLAVCASEWVGSFRVCVCAHMDIIQCQFLNYGGYALVPRTPIQECEERRRRCFLANN